jgi:hypothetical protein
MSDVWGTPCSERWNASAVDATTPLSQQSINQLCERAVELRQMAQTATTEAVRAALLALAARFDALVDKRSAGSGERRGC